MAINIATFLLFLPQISVAIFIFFIAQFSIRFLDNKSKRLPPGPKGWPFVGALPLLGHMPHVTLTCMAKKYGPIVYLKMGPTHTMVVSTSVAAKTFLKTLDFNFSGRPKITGVTYLGYNRQDLVFSEYGERWTVKKKLSNMHMLGSKAIEDLAHVRAEELGKVLRSMWKNSQKAEPIDVEELASFTITNIMCQVIHGHRFFTRQGLESKEFMKNVKEFTNISGVTFGDFMPSFNWLDLQGVVGKMKRLHKKFDVLLQKMVDKHIMENHDDDDNRKKKKSYFLDALIASTQEASAHERLNISEIKALILNLFTAGTDSSTSIITWAVAEMLKNPSIMNKAQKEMDIVVGRERRIVESDIPKLPYLQAICKETYRLHPSTPLSIPRLAAQACEVDGYYIPKNTWLNVNIYAIGRDPNVWENPLEFNPERFMNGNMANISPSGVDFELIPFGAGRRICAGYKMAIVMIDYILATFVHSFDWKLLEGSEIDMEEAFGLTLHKAKPMYVMVTPRLLPHAYA